MCARDDVRGRRHFADVKFHVAHHPAVGGDLGDDVREPRVDAIDRNTALEDSFGVRILGDGDIQRDRRLGHWIILLT